MNIFVCMVPLHYYFYRTLSTVLKDSYFIIPPFEDKQKSSYGCGMSGNGLYNYLYSFLKQKNARVLNYGNITKNNFINFISQEQNNIFCPHVFDGIYEVENCRIFKIVYGIPNNSNKVQFNFSQNFIFNMNFTFGMESQNRFEEAGIPSIAVGNPMFDNWFQNKIDETSLINITNKLDKNKKTLLYLPTHSSYSSFDIFIDSIIELKKNYNIIVKVHHLTFNNEPDRLCRLLSYTDILTLGDFFDPLVLYKVSDLVLTDTSGALFDVMLTQKPLIMLKAGLPYEINLSDDKNNYVSIKDLVYFCDNTKNLQSMIKHALDNPMPVNDNLMYMLFHIRDGKTSERIAENINNTQKLPFKPTIDKYNDAIKNAQNKNCQKRILELKEYFIEKNIGPVNMTITQKVKKYVKSLI